jgi:hypothetical protein
MSRIFEIIDEAILPLVLLCLMGMVMFFFYKIAELDAMNPQTEPTETKCKVVMRDNLGHTTEIVGVVYQGKKNER